MAAYLLIVCSFNLENTECLMCSTLSPCKCSGLSFSPIWKLFSFVFIRENMRKMTNQLV